MDKDGKLDQVQNLLDRVQSTLDEIRDLGGCGAGAIEERPHLCCGAFEDATDCDMIIFEDDQWIIQGSTIPVQYQIDYCPFCGASLKDET